MKAGLEEDTISIHEKSGWALVNGMVLAEAGALIGPGRHISCADVISYMDPEENSQDLRREEVGLCTSRKSTTRVPSSSVLELDVLEDEGRLQDMERVDRCGIKCRLDSFWKREEMLWSFYMAYVKRGFVNVASSTLAVVLFAEIRMKGLGLQNSRHNGIYLDSLEFFNGDISYITNFTNLNKKMDVRFEYINIKVYLGNKLIGAQAIHPFT
ncbi:hypothetical protein LINPERHAP1_LOCUS21038 [Linum perenne]